MISLDALFTELSYELDLSPSNGKLTGDVYTIIRDEMGLSYHDKTSSFTTMLIPDISLTYHIRTAYLDAKRNLLSASQTQIGQELAREFALFSDESDVESVSAHVRLENLSEVKEFTIEHILHH